jgi:Mrp family chromosome partitioning ATPase
VNRVVVKPVIAVTGGFPGTGKTTLILAVAADASRGRC